MFCPHCGMNNPEGSLFCVACGNRIAPEQPAYQPPVQPQQPMYEMPVQPQQPVYEAPVQPQQPVYEAPVQPQQPVFQQPPYQQPPYQQFPYQQNGYQQPPYQQAAPVPGKGLGIAGMILGIISLVFCCCTEYISIPCAVVGLILSIIGLSSAKKAGMKNGCAVAGIVCSAISLVLVTIALVLAYTVFAEFMEQFYQQFDGGINDLY
ncbi:MAG: hypothetical protein IJW14_03435 [Oscillospiraceae bacterium]|nr:hypothetical protein [Oscillospiraceae bacterium]